jgi:thiol-disulfide isomerase/thioredoxin
MSTHESIISKIQSGVGRLIPTTISGIYSRHSDTIFYLLIVLIIFITLVIYLYETSLKEIINQKYVANKEFIDYKPQGGTIIYYFYTDWCPYCKKSYPEWSAFKNYINKNLIYDLCYNIIFKEIDCDEEPAIANRFNVEAYPTIKILHNDTIYTYDAKPNEQHLIEFLDGTLTIDKTSFTNKLLAFFTFFIPWY